MRDFWFFWVDTIVHFKQPGKGVTRDQTGIGYRFGQGTLVERESYSGE